MVFIVKKPKILRMYYARWKLDVKLILALHPAKKIAINA
jgi:hypothetical protein